MYLKQLLLHLHHHLYHPTIPSPLSLTPNFDILFLIPSGPTCPVLIFLPSVLLQVISQKDDLASSTDSGYNTTHMKATRRLGPSLAGPFSQLLEILLNVQIRMILNDHAAIFREWCF